MFMFVHAGMGGNRTPITGFGDQRSTVELPSLACGWQEIRLTGTLLVHMHMAQRSHAACHPHYLGARYLDIHGYLDMLVTVRLDVVAELLLEGRVRLNLAQVIDEGHSVDHVRVHVLPL